MNDIVIIGAGDFGREVACIIERINEKNPTWNLLGFIDDDDGKIGENISGYKVVGNSSWLIDYEDSIYAVCSFGEGKTRENVISKLNMNKHIKFPVIVDPSAVIFKNVTLGEGTIVCAGAVISLDVTFGKHSIFNLNCTVGHDTCTGDYFTAHPGTNISGKVIIGEHVYCGTGSKIIQGITIGDDVVFGAGCVVVKNVTEKGVYVGMPAERLTK